MKAFMKYIGIQVSFFFLENKFTHFRQKNSLLFAKCWPKSQCRLLQSFQSSPALQKHTLCLSVKYSAYKCSYMILMSFVWYAYGYDDCVRLCLVAVVNIDVSWPLFVAEGNRGYEHRLSLIYLFALSFHHFYFLAIYLALNISCTIPPAFKTHTHTHLHTSSCILLGKDIKVFL